MFWLLAEPLVTVDCTKLAINPLPIDVNSTFLSFFRIFRRSSSTLFSSTIAPTSTSNLVPRPSRIFPAAFLDMLPGMTPPTGDSGSSQQQQSESPNPASSATSNLNPGLLQQAMFAGGPAGASIMPQALFPGIVGM